MPWTVTDTMNQRTTFIQEYQKGLFSMTELCRRFNISRKTGYKWLQRHHQGGLQALNDQSRAPKHSPQRTPETITTILLETRKAHPRWGPRKILDYLRPRHPQINFPAPSTVGDMLKREGLVTPKRPRRRHSHPGSNALVAQAPGQVWTADFKGEFRLASRKYCYPLTIQDAYSRYLLACHGLGSTASEGVKPVFQRLFESFGLPSVIRTDNGSPFASKAIAGLSRLSLWWIQLGIDPDRITPGCPQQNGRHERMHKTLKAEATRPPEKTFARQQKRFDTFRQEFNDIRPHQALGGQTPCSQFAPCAREMPVKVPSPAYGGHYEVRRVSSVGAIKFKGEVIFVSGTLAGHQVGLEEVDDGIWNVVFYHVLLGRLDERTGHVASGTG